MLTLSFFQNLRFFLAIVSLRTYNNRRQLFCRKEKGCFMLGLTYTTWYHPKNNLKLRLSFFPIKKGNFKLNSTTYPQAVFLGSEMFAAQDEVFYILGIMSCNQLQLLST